MQPPTVSSTTQTSVNIIRNYKPTNEIKLLFTELQLLSNEHYNLGLHNKVTLNNAIYGIIQLVKENQTENWKFCSTSY